MTSRNLLSWIGGLLQTGAQRQAMLARLPVSTMTSSSIAYLQNAHTHAVHTYIPTSISADHILRMHIPE